MAATATRTARIEARVTPEALALVRQAAALQGRSVSSFIMAAAEAAAREAVADANTVRLSPEDYALFMERMLNPGPISPAMRRAHDNHERLFGSK